MALLKSQALPLYLLGKHVSVLLKLKQHLPWEAFPRVHLSPSAGTLLGTCEMVQSPKPLEDEAGDTNNGKCGGG